MRITEWKMSPSRHISKQNAPPPLLSADTSSGLFKYVDDTEVYKVVENKRTSHAQSILDEVSAWSTKNKFQLHSCKSDELKITFALSSKNRELVGIDCCKIHTVRVVKLVDFYIPERLKGNSHVTEMIKKATKRIFYNKLANPRALIGRELWSMRV